MKADLEKFLSMSLPRFLRFMILTGGFAGFFAWLLVFGGSMIFDISTPTLTSLFFAMLRGSLFAIILGLILRFFWRRKE